MLLIAEVVSQFKKIGSLDRKLRKLKFKLENKSNHQPVHNSGKFHRNAENLWLGSKFHSPWETVVPSNDTYTRPGKGQRGNG